MMRWVVGLLCVSLAGRAGAVEPAGGDPRVAELERKVDVLAQEIEALKLGAVAETTRYESRRGLAPAASKVYGASRGVSIAGYGEMLLERFDRDREDGAGSQRRDRIDFLRQVLYVGYKFSDLLLFNSEIEIEHAGVRDAAEVRVDPLTGEGEAELSGEVRLEFAYIEWAPRRAIGLRAGMMLVPLGLMNEIHEPPVTIGARRPGVERLVLPTTWRGNGAGLFGEAGWGLSWRAYLMEGLNANGFSAAGGIRGGRQEGSRSIVNRPAVTARLDWSGGPGLLAGASVYTGDSWQLAQPAGSALRARVTLHDLHARLDWRGLAARAVYAQGRIGQTERLSDELGLSGSDRLGDRFFGGYAEAACDVAPLLRPGTEWGLLPYARLEAYDTQEDVTTGVEDPANRRSVVTAGLAVKPHPNVIFKADREWRHNDARTETRQWNVALGYMF
jgi:hypothetical protein